MKKLLPLALALGLMMPLAHAQKKTEPAKEKPAAAETKPAAAETKKPEKKTKEATADKKKEPSAADKQLMAEAKKVADSLTDAQRAQLLDLLNKGDDKALEAVEGIGAVRAKNIIAKRPYTKVEDVAMVDGIGIATFKNLAATVNPAAKTEKPKTTKEKAPKPETKPAKAKTATDKAAPEKTTPDKK
jgi:DNA uptake protein ComE-like DNA-binding protein